jgi:hypothetical protein
MDPLGRCSTDTAPAYDPQTPADIRTVIRCVLEDHLLPAIHDLRAAAGHGEKKG